MHRPAAATLMLAFTAISLLTLGRAPGAVVLLPRDLAPAILSSTEPVSKVS